MGERNLPSINRPGGHEQFPVSIKSRNSRSKGRSARRPIASPLAGDRYARGKNCSRFDDFRITPHSRAPRNDRLPQGKSGKTTLILGNHATSIRTPTDPSAIGSSASSHYAFPQCPKLFNNPRIFESCEAFSWANNDNLSIPTGLGDDYTPRFAVVIRLFRIEASGDGACSYASYQRRRTLALSQTG
jgi:hypothetical protein